MKFQVWRNFFPYARNSLLTTLNRLSFSQLCQRWQPPVQYTRPVSAERETVPSTTKQRLRLVVIPKETSKPLTMAGTGVTCGRPLTTATFAGNARLMGLKVTQTAG
jgi:hypothetical protein